MTKYKLTNETKTLPNGVVLKRIELTEDCKWGKAGDKGGWIEKESNLQGDAWVYGNAWVSGNAKVYGNACVYGDALVSGNACVYGNAEVCGNAQVCGDAKLSESEKEYTMEELEKIVGHKFKIK